MAYDFSALTPRQQRLLAAGGWRLGRGKQPLKCTVAKLLERGLIVAEPRNVISTKVDEYSVPAEVSAAWRAYTATQTAESAA